MSFEEDMIEEGFADEQDYFDYICSEADARIEKIYPGEETDDDSRNRLRIQNKQLRFLGKWEKQESSGKARLWNIIWNHYESVVRYNKLDKYQYWEEWVKSDRSFNSWQRRHKDELDVLNRRHFAKYFAEYVAAITPSVVIHNNRELMKVSKSRIAAKKRLITDASESLLIRLKAWKDLFIKGKSKEWLLFDYWANSNNDEWINWLNVNYQYIRYFLIEDDPSLANFINTVVNSNNINGYSLPNEDKEILRGVVYFHVLKWGDLFKNDIKRKYARALKKGMTDLFKEVEFKEFHHKTDWLNEIIDNRARLFSFHPLNLFDEIEWIRPLSHPHKARVGIVLPGAFREDLKSIPISEEEANAIEEEVNAFYDDLYSGISADDTDYEEWLTRKKEILRQKKCLLNRSGVSRLPRNLSNYLSLLPQDDIKYEDYEYFGHGNNLVFYFLTNHLKEYELDSLIKDNDLDSLYNFDFKAYKNETDFSYHELNYFRFNEWCEAHHLPSFSDCLIYYWYYYIADSENVLLQIWLNYWRGKKWIEHNNYSSLTDEEIFHLWYKVHTKDWEKWERGHFQQYKKAFTIVDSCLKWLLNNQYSLKSLLLKKSNEVVVEYRRSMRERYDAWLSQFVPRHLTLKEWKKENREIMSLLKHRFERITLLNLWNETHDESERVYIVGLND